MNIFTEEILRHYNTSDEILTESVMDNMKKKQMLKKLAKSCYSLYYSMINNMGNKDRLPSKEVDEFRKGIIKCDAENKDKIKSGEYNIKSLPIMKIKSSVVKQYPKYYRQLIECLDYFLKNDRHYMDLNKSIKRQGDLISIELKFKNE